MIFNSFCSRLIVFSSDWTHTILRNYLTLPKTCESGLQIYDSRLAAMTIVFNDNGGVEDNCWSWGSGEPMIRWNCFSHNHNQLIMFLLFLVICFRRKSC